MITRSTVHAFTTKDLAVCSIFIAVTAICAQITIPIGTVPVSLSLLPVLICGALLPVRLSLLSMGAYMLLGLFGLPVFSNMMGGPAKLLGVTGGYILGYLPCVWIIGTVLKRKDNLFITCLSMAVGVALCYTVGTLWFMSITHTNLQSSLATCVIPFLPFDAIKIVLAAYISIRIKPYIEGK